VWLVLTKKMKNNFYTKLKNKGEKTIKGVRNALIQLKLLLKNRRKGKNYKTRVFEYKIYFSDPRSFYNEFIYIFKNEMYGFHPTKANPTIIDGGGFIGTSALYFKKICPQAHITIFEPDRSALTLLRKNISENKLEDITIIEKGLYDKEGKVSFLPDNTDGGKISADGTHSIEVTQLSAHIKDGVDFLKLNIEGSELKVFEDLDKNNKLKNIKELCVEYHSFKNSEQNLDKILGILTKNNFRYYIGNFAHSPKGKYVATRTFFLLVYAQNMEPAEKNCI